MNDEPDQEAIAAAADLVGRTGARNLTVGFLHEDVPVEEAGWWAKAQYKGAVIMVEDHKGLDLALEALAQRLLRGAQCRFCGREVTLGGSRQASDVFRCRWRREGPEWLRGCVETHHERRVPKAPFARGE